MRRTAALLVSMVALGSAWRWSTDHARHLREVAEGQTREAALRGAREVLAELSRHEEQVLRQASSFAELKGIAQLVQGVGAADQETLRQVRNTLADLLRDEPWSERWARLGTIAFVIGGDLVFIRGADRLPAGTEALVQQARTSGSARGLVEDQDRLLLVGVARTQGTTRHQTPAEVVLLAPLAPEQLAPVAARLAGGVVLAAAGAEVAAGDVRELQALRVLVRSPVLEPGPGSAVLPVSDGVRLAVWLDPAPTLEAAEAQASFHQVGALGLAILLGAVMLFLGFRGGEAGDATRLLEETTAELQRSRDELRRLSRLIPPTEVTSPPPRGTGAWAGLTPGPGSGSRYVEVAPLAEGGLARVSLAELRGAEGFRRRLVVKRLKPEFGSNPEIVSQFIDEARLGASLVHSNIVPVFDFGRDAEGYFLTQEYILGRDVDTVVRASRARRGGWALERELVLYLAQEVLKALAYAHGRTDDAGHPLRLVHRDISPFNLMISASGEVKLLDFGIVKGEQRLTRTRAGTVKGNLCFMSPEQARGQDVDARSDLFSLGLVLYTAASGETLYGGRTTFELLKRAGAGPTSEDLRQVRSLPHPLGPLIARALAVDPARRYPTAEAFAREVAAAGTLGTAASLHALMEYLFHEEFCAESNRLLARSSA